MAEQRYGDAIAELEAVLSASNGEGEAAGDFFLPGSGASATQTSIKSAAQQLVGSMPRRGLELYELQFGADARALLAAALKTTDFEQLNKVVRRYFHTQAGYEATLLLGRLHWDRGYPLAAALCFQRLAESPAAAKFEPELSILLAASWLYADRPQRAAATMAALKRRFPQASAQIGTGNPETLPDPDMALVWLEQRFPQGAKLATGTEEWLVHRGDGSRNAMARGGMPLSSLRWRAPTAELPADETLIGELQSSRHDEGDSVPSLSPLAVNGVVLMRSPERMLAIDFRTGKRIWHYPWDSAYPAATLGRRGFTQNQEQARRKEQLDQRLWRDVPYGQVSSDGHSVYMLDDLRYAPSTGTMRWIPGRGQRANSQWPQNHNQLVALDLKRQGSLKWVVGGGTGMDEPQLAGAFFLGAPLPLDGQLFVLAEINSVIRLVVLDGQTGSQQWSQQLAHVDMLSIVNSQRRRLAGASPSFADGVLVCPTTAGAVVAIELASRSLLWGYNYGALQTQRTLRSRVSTPPVQWVDATATVAGGSVVVTPGDSNQLLCLDLLTGNPRWDPIQPQAQMKDAQFVACVHEGRLVLGSRRGMFALSMDDGAPAWDAPLRLDDTPVESLSGRGFQTGRYYYLPTTASRLIKVDLHTGQIADETRTNQVLGNLICYEDEVISQGTDYLATFYQLEPLRERVERRLSESPEDTWALARQGELFINDGRLRPAIRSLRRAHELRKDDVAIGALLVDTILTALQEDFTGYRETAAELQHLIDRPRQRLEYLRLMAAGLHDVGEDAQAAHEYLRLVDLILEEIDGEELDAIPLVQIDEHGKARIDRWLRLRLSDLFRSANEAVKLQLSLEVERRWKEVSRDAIGELQRFLAFFDFHPQAVAARTELALRFAESDRPLEAELLIAQLARQPARTAETVSTVARVGAVLNERGSYEDAAAFYRMLSHQWRDATDSSGRTGYEIAREAAAAGPLGQVMKIRRWPWGRADASSPDMPGVRNRPQVVSIPIRRSSSVFDDIEYRVEWTRSADARLFIRDGHGRVVTSAAVDRNKYPPANGLNYAERCGHLLLVVVGDSIRAMDMLKPVERQEEIVLWSERFAQSSPRSRRYPASGGSPGRQPRGNPLDPLDAVRYFVQDRTEKAIGMVGAVNPDGVVYLKSRTLVCADPITGQPLWERENIESGSEIFGDEDHVFVVAKDATTALMVSAIDGSVVGTRRLPGHRWNSSGRHVLAWESDTERRRVRLFLYDPKVESEIWSEEFVLGARGTLTSSSVAVMEPAGRLIIRSLRDDTVEVDANLTPENRLNAIYLQRSTDQYLLVTDRGTEEDIRGRSFPDAPIVDGRVYAFERGSGKPRWQTPARIAGFGFPLRQPAGLPTVWFIRKAAKKEAGVTRSSKADVLCIDRRDGRLLYRQHDIANIGRRGSYSVESDFNRRTVRLLLPQATVGIRFTERPIPPEPPAQVFGS